MIMWLMLSCGTRLPLRFSKNVSYHTVKSKGKNKNSKCILTFATLKNQIIYVCLCVYMYCVYMYIYTYCVYMYMYIYIVCIYVLCLCVYMYVCILLLCVSVCIYVCILLLKFIEFTL